jgi:hypothetical protein
MLKVLGVGLMGSLLLSAVPAEAQTALSLDRSTSGLLNKGDTSENGRSFDTYALRVRDGVEYVITMDGEFDTLLRLETPGGTQLGRNDDGGDGLNSRLVWTADRTGTVHIIATSFGRDAEGSYTIEARELVNDGDGGGNGLGTHRGSLTASDPQLTDDSRYDEYRVDVRRNHTYIFSLESSNFDAYLILMDLDGDTIASDDDGGDGLDSYLEWTADRTGTIRVIANSYRAGARGAYRLDIREEAGGGGDDGGGGRTWTGRLSSNDGMLPDDSYYDSHSYSVTRGQQYTITLSSSDFDTYLIIRDANGNTLASNDDGGAGLDSRLTWTADRTGTIRILANSYRARQTGSYTLRVR